MRLSDNRTRAQQVLKHVPTTVSETACSVAWHIVEMIGPRELTISR